MQASWVHRQLTIGTYSEQDHLRVLDGRKAQADYLVRHLAVVSPAYTLGTEGERKFPCPSRVSIFWPARSASHSPFQDLQPENRIRQMEPPVSKRRVLKRTEA